MSTDIKVCSFPFETDKADNLGMDRVALDDSQSISTLRIKDGEDSIGV